ncbi:MAG: hypothetical protein O3A93_14340 [Chloroflexi bacterium]|nr:hypothetical protein [Chloroflexota bacterium]MDA1272407.1 hypothetical protein [Chloroflexota bacterium]
MISKRFKPIVVGLAVALGALALSACGSDSGAPVATSAPATSAPPAATTTPVATTAPPTPTVQAMEATQTPPTSTPEPTATPEPPAEPTPTPVLDTVIADYGFTLNLDLGANVKTTGYLEPEPNEAQGLANFVYGGVNTSLVWGPAAGRTSLGFLATSYNVLRAAQPEITFQSIREGAITVSGQKGSYGGFKALNSASETIGGGLIGTWNCGNDTAYRMTLTGADATVVQLRFDRLLDNFICPIS